MHHSDNLHDAYLTTRWQQFCAGDKHAFGEVTESYYVALHHYGTRFTSDRDLIKDCLQDLFLELWEKRESLLRITSIKPYLFQSLRNNLLRSVKKQAKFLDASDPGHEPLDEVYPESDWIINETEQLTSHRLKKAIDSLPKRQREALYLRYYENLSYEEIATVMGLQRQAVANYLQHGIQKLRDYWQYVAIILSILHFE